ncbi:MAG: histidinol dehydrogenase [Azospirillaceae bacterium]
MSSEINLHVLDALSPDDRARLMVRTEADLSKYADPVARIIEAVRTEGDAALARFAREFDKSPVDADAIAATEADFERAFDSLEPEVVAAIEFAVGNIRAFHEDQMPERMWLEETQPGAYAGERWSPIPSVACYVPRGKGSFPSVVMMTTIPAVVAGVPDIAVITPPGPDGEVDDATLVAAKLAGVTNVYKCGGAQGVAAVAYGTETVPRCRKIVGPGSPWVLAAKAQLAHRIDTGTPAGPSESIVLADATANPAIAALDLIIESEHGPDSSAYLVTDSREVAEAARAAIPEYWAQMGEQRVGFSKAVLGGERGGIVLAPDFAAAVAFVNDYAPEHLEILGAEPFAHLGKIEHAGEVLLGENTPITLGNFVLGPNAVLPTGGNARTYSPLSVFDCLKRIGIGYVTAEGYRLLAPHARTLALYEGFDGHANALSETRERAKAGKIGRPVSAG